MTPYIVGAAAGICIALLWHWALLRAVEELTTGKRSIPWSIGSMLLRLLLIGSALAGLLVTLGLPCMLTAFVTMMVVRYAAGILTLQRMQT